MPHAIHQHQYGGPEVLQWEPVELPPLAPTEVRVQTLAAAVNRADLEIRSGHWPIQATPPFPYTPGLEVVGKVIECGAQVEQVDVGDTVITMMQKLGGVHGVRPGGYQEIVTLPANTLAFVPPMLNPLAVAALGLAAVTAYNGFKRLQMTEGQTLLVTGATGGVGSAAVQFAKAAGLRVLATTHSAEKETYLRQLGVDEVVNLAAGKVPPRSVEGVLETTGGAAFEQSVAALKRGGRLCLLGAASGEKLTFRAIDLLLEVTLTGWLAENLTVTEMRSDLRLLFETLEAGEIQPPPYQTVPLAEAARAHALMESRAHTGRVLLVPV